MKKNLAILAGPLIAALMAQPVMAKPGGIKADSGVSSASCSDPDKEDNVLNPTDAGLWWVQQSSTSSKNLGAGDHGVLVSYDDGSSICVYEVTFQSCNDGKWYFAEATDDTTGGSLGEVLTAQNGITTATLLLNNNCDITNPTISSDTYDVEPAE